MTRPGGLDHRGAINALAELRDAGAERAYRQWDFVHSAGQARRAILIAAGLFALVGINDLIQLGFGAGSLALVGLRLLVLVFAGLCAAVVLRTNRPQTVARSVLVFELMAVTAHWILVASRYGDPVSAALPEMLVLLAIYLVIPNRFVFTVLAGFAATLGYLWIASAYLGADAFELLHVASVLGLANVLGGLYGWRMHVLRRVEYRELMAERELRSALEEEIARRAKLEQELRRHATTDPLTGAANRRHFMELGEKELMRSRRYQRPLSVMLIDLDNFKRINDTLGHAAGDAVLRRLAGVLKNSLRASDVIGRLGGDEFAVLVPELDEAEAVQMAERVRGAMAIPAVGYDQPVTISVGVAGLGPEDRSVEDALHRADRALYRSKEQGRNQVACA